MGSLFISLLMWGTVVQAGASKEWKPVNWAIGTYKAVEGVWLQNGDPIGNCRINLNSKQFDLVFFGLKQNSKYYSWSSEDSHVKIQDGFVDFSKITLQERSRASITLSDGLSSLTILLDNGSVCIADLRSLDRYFTFDKIPPTWTQWFHDNKYAMLMIFGVPNIKTIPREKIVVNFVGKNE